MKEAEWWDKRRRSLLSKHGEAIGSARYDKEVEDGTIREGVDIDREDDFSEVSEHLEAPPLGESVVDVSEEDSPPPSVHKDDGTPEEVEREKHKRKQKLPDGPGPCEVKVSKKKKG